MKKIIVVEIIFLFFGIAVAPSINFNVVQASQEDAFVEVTAQACGISGFGKTAVTLTKEQYLEVEKLFDDVQVNVQTVKTQEKALTLYLKTLTDLTKYGLVPKQMHAMQIGNLMIDRCSKDKQSSIFKKFSYNNRLEDNQNNCCCFVAGVVHDGYAPGVLGTIGMIIQILAIAGFPVLFALIGGLLIAIGDLLPFSVMGSITLFSADFISVGLLGFKNHTIPPNSGTGKIFGFNGIKLTNIATGEIRFCGFALAVIDLSHD